MSACTQHLCWSSFACCLQALLRTDSKILRSWYRYRYQLAGLRQPQPVTVLMHVPILTCCSYVLMLCTVSTYWSPRWICEVQHCARESREPRQRRVLAQPCMDMSGVTPETVSACFSSKVLLHFNAGGWCRFTCRCCRTRSARVQCTRATFAAQFGSQINALFSVQQALSC
jgi:hypothetical protein